MTNAQTISLTPLSDEDTARLVGGLLDQALLPAEVQQTLLERAEGNPLYAQEYVRMLQDRELLVRQAGGWTLAGDIVELPESLHGIIAARLDTLGSDEKALIQDAAVVGKTAWVGAVCALSERSAWQAEELLHNLERKQLVQRVRRSSIQGETEFQFGHALTRDVAYSQIRRADRAQKHEAAALWIEQLAGERDDKAELLADHYTQALSLRDAMGEDTSPIAVKARIALTEAAYQAAATYAHTAAARHFEAALNLTGADDSTSRAALLLGRATALINADMADEELLTAALDAQVRVEAWESAAQVERMLGRWHQDEGRAADAETHLARAATHARRVPPGDTMCMVAYDQAFRLTISGHPEQALALVDEMIPLVEQAGLEVGRALLQTWRGSARVELGDPDGIADMRAAAEFLAAHAHARTTAAYANLADAVRGLSGISAADPIYAEAARWASRFAVPFYRAWVTLERAYQAYHTGRWGEARDLVAAEMADASGFVETQAHVVRGRLRLGEGHLREALQTAEAAVAYGIDAAHDEIYYLGTALEARCHSSLGNDSPALEACDRFLTRWHDTGGMTSRSPELCEIALILAQAGRHDDIRRAATLLPEACRWRDALLLTADQHYADAALLYTEIGSQPLAADAHLLAADQATEEGRLADAAQHARAVLTFAEQTGATLYQRQAMRFTKAATA